MTTTPSRLKLESTDEYSHYRAIVITFTMKLAIGKEGAVCPRGQIVTSHKKFPLLKLFR